MGPGASQSGGRRRSPEGRSSQPSELPLSRRQPRLVAVLALTLATPERPRRLAVAERLPRVRKNSFECLRGVGQRRLECPPRALLHGGLDVPPERIELLFGETALSHQMLCVAFDRVTSFPFLEQLARHVAHVVVRAVAVHPP